MYIVTDCLGLPGPVPVLALKVPHIRKPLHSRQIGTFGPPNVGQVTDHRPWPKYIDCPGMFMADAYLSQHLCIIGKEGLKNPQPPTKNCYKKLPPLTSRQFANVKRYKIINNSLEVIFTQQVDLTWLVPRSCCVTMRAFPLEKI